MSARLDLVPDEQAELARLLDGGSLGTLLSGWSALVAQVERGYDDSIYEYTNDLSVRDRLERVVGGAGPGLRAKLEAALAADDGRFDAATEDGARPLGESGGSRPGGGAACRGAAPASWRRTWRRSDTSPAERRAATRQLLRAGSSSAGGMPIGVRTSRPMGGSPAFRTATVG